MSDGLHSSALSTKPRGIERQGIRLAAKLDLVRDRNLKDYILAFGPLTSTALNTRRASRKI